MAEKKDYPCPACGTKVGLWTPTGQVRQEIIAVNEEVELAVTYEKHQCSTCGFKMEFVKAL